MNVVFSASKYSRALRRLLKPRNPSSLLPRQLSAEPNPDPPSAAPSDDESTTINEALNFVLQNPPHDWPSSQSLHTLLFTSPDPSPRIFIEIIRRLPSYSRALDFFNYLRNSSPLQDTKLLSSAFQAVLYLASQEPDSPKKLFELYQSSKEWKVPLTINAAKLLIRFFGKADLMRESNLVFTELDPSLKNTHVRNVFIDVLFRAGHVDDALKVLDEMLQRESEVPPDDLTGNIVFHALLKRDRKGRSVGEEEIAELVLEFGEYSIFPNSFSLTQLITRLCRSGKTCQAWNFLHELMKQRAPLEAASFNALLTGLGRDNDVNKMNALLVEMKDGDIQPDVVTFGILINKLCKLRRVDEALEVFQKMREGKESDGISVEGDVVMYNTLIDGLCKVGRQEEGLSLMEEMRSQNGCAPNTVTYNCLIDGFCKAGEIERAHELFDQMNKEGVTPNVVTLNTLVHGLCRHGRIKSAYEFFNEMQSKGLKGNATTYTALISAFSNANNTDMALDLFDQMLKIGCSADAIVYYSLISGLSQAGRMHDASNVLSKLKEARFSPDIVCYNVLISGFCKKNMLNKAYEILKEMEEAGVKPDNLTYNTLITYFSKAGNFAVVEKVMRIMSKEGIEPTVVTYGALIHAYCLNGKIDEAMTIFRKMSSSSKVPPNTIIHNILIDSLCKNNEVEKALSLMDDMKIRAVKPNTTTYNAMLKGLKEKNCLEAAFKLMDKMIEDACSPDYITMEILVEWLTATGETERLKKFVQGYKVSSSTA